MAIEFGVNFKENLAKVAAEFDIAEYVRNNPKLQADALGFVLGNRDGLLGRERNWSMPDAYHRGYLRGRLARRKREGGEL